MKSNTNEVEKSEGGGGQYYVASSWEYLHQVSEFYS